ncbi:MAG: radical SAM protein [Candidatus Omnitrophica bacterium]|nr:radical SAM protein [Candidatus Omnitrophota bacterium]MDD5736841.1 radical SAM protein [Candidatus Omnitrophota bacterium]
MKFQIVVVPSLPSSIATYPPYGALYIATSLKQEGHEVRIENGDLDKFSNEELIGRIRAYSPDVVGISATVSTSYKFVKEISALIKKELPGIKVIIGGGLSAAAEVVMNNTAVDIVVVGEGDITIKELAKRFVSGAPVVDVDGIFFRENGRIISTKPRKPIINLDTLPYPDFSLIDSEKYLMDVKSYVSRFIHYKNPDPRLYEPHRSAKMFRVPISRGCINRCSFCYRSVPGLRNFSFKYIFDYIEYLMKRYEINVFSFGDECFAASTAWGWKFVEELRSRKLDIMFQVLGTKVETMDRELLRALKEAGCFIIEYGFESGSQKMLNVMDKRVTVQQNINAAVWTREAGLFTMPAFVLGMPGETKETICETIDFMEAIGYDPEWYQYTFAFAVPGTPLYEYAKITGLITNEDKYLESIYYSTPNNFLDSETFINFTSEPFEVVSTWPGLIKERLIRHYAKNGVFYFINKHIRPQSIAYNIKNYGLRKTFLKAIGRLAGISKGRVFARTDRPIPAAADEKRERYVALVEKYLGRGTPGSA